MTEYGVSLIRKASKMYENTSHLNFQKTMGEYNQLMIGQNLRDLFPMTIAELPGGLVVTRMRME